MKKTHNIKATKLMVDDHIKIGSQMYRINNLTKSFGRKRDRVFIRLTNLSSRHSCISLSVPAKETFTIFN